MPEPEGIKPTRKQKRPPDGELFIWYFGMAIGALGGFGAGALFIMFLFHNGILAVSRSGGAG